MIGVVVDLAVKSLAIFGMFFLISSGMTWIFSL